MSEPYLGTVNQCFGKKHDALSGRIAEVRPLRLAVDIVVQYQPRAVPAVPVRDAQGHDLRRDSFLRVCECPGGKEDVPATRHFVSRRD